MSNLRLINETTASSVSSVSITDVFSSDYDIYKIEVVGQGAGSTNWSRLEFLNTSGSTISTSNYDFAQHEIKTYGSFSENRTTNNSQFLYLWIDNDSAGGFGNTMYVFNPMSSAYTFILGQSAGEFSTSGNVNTKYIGALTETTQAQGFTFVRATGTYNNITVRTYGLRVDS